MKLPLVAQPEGALSEVGVLEAYEIPEAIQFEAQRLTVTIPMVTEAVR